MNIRIYWMLVLVAFVLMLAAPPIDAFDLTYIVDDYNTLQPIDDASIILTNGTSNISGSTDVHGEYIFSLSGPQIYNVSVTHSGYTPYASSLNVTNTTTENIYLAPSSHEGIIRLTVIDLSLSEHKSLIYFDNGRLMGVYDLNDTITLHTNMNYTWVPALDKTDLLLNKKGLIKYSWNYLSVGIGAVLFFSVVAIFLGFLWRIIKK